MSFRTQSITNTGACRSAKGQGMIVLLALIAVLVLFVVGLFTYEVNRVEVCRGQLRAACDAAALAAAATLASQDNIDPVDAHQQAIDTALTTFKANSVGGVQLSQTSLAYVSNDNPAAKAASLFIEFLDPNNNDSPVEVGDPAGKLVRITATFGLLPSFGNFLGLSKLPLRTTSAGGVPELDVVLCFDVSGSIDDQTPVTFVKRQWTGTAAGGNIQYQLCRTRAGSPVAPNAQGKIYDIIGPPASGTRVNAVAPQYLASSSQSDVRWPIYFSETQAASRGLRGTTTAGAQQNTGSRPGNYPGNTVVAGLGTAALSPYTYTDVVVNIDGRNTFGGLATADGYNFPDIGTVVEAARGNLESNAVFTSSGANRSLPATVAPRAGYQAKYLSLAMANLHPIGDAQDAASDFFTIMNTNTRGHFSCICFSDNAGVNASTTYTAPALDTSYNGGGSGAVNGNYPVPNIALNRTEGATNYTAIQGMLPSTIATTSTNIGEALDRAVTQLTSQNRLGSKRAIVLFTDGMPTAPASDPEGAARTAARRARDAGIPIYSIGLAQNPEIIPGETANLTHTNSSLTTGGVSGIAGNGGQFFLVTNVSDLRKTFENIARQLVALVN